MKINNKYPFINFIQKTEDIKGLEKSLNLILDLIKTYTYWIHWDESWYSTRSFIYDAIQIMDNTKITQLQFTKENDITDFDDKIVLTNCHKMPNENNYCILKEESILYSIKPSINRVKDYNFGKFLIDPKYEIDFGQRWMNNKNIKAIFLEGSVTR